MRLLFAWLLACAPAAAQNVATPVILPPAAPLGSVGAVSFAAPAGLQAAPARAAGLALAPVPGLLAAPMPAGRAVPSAGAHVEADGLAAPVSTKERLASAVSSLAEARDSSPGGALAHASGTLGRAFDGSGVRLGAPSAGASAAGAEAGPGARGPPKRELGSISSLKLGTYNMLNLFEKVGDHAPDPDRPGRLKRVTDRVAKEERQLREQAKAILESDLDVVVAQEIENVRALEDFNRDYLGGAYRALLIEGNDERGIDIAFLVKRDLPFELEHRTHKEELWRDPALGGRERRLFSRDLPALILRAEGQPQPLLVLLGAHLKSKRDRAGDPESETLRRAQVERTAEIVGRYKAEFGEDVPLMIAGDFNGDLNREAAFKPLWKAGFANSLDLGPSPTPARDRVTHTYHPKGEPSHAAQMDGLLVNGALKGLVRKSEVYRYRDADGSVRPIPRTFEERAKNPSDHFPLLATLEFQPLVARLGPLAEARTAR